MLPTRNYAGIDSAITQRPVSSAILGIDSEDRASDLATVRNAGIFNASPVSGPYSFQINKATSILNGFFTRIGITELVFPWVVPNVNKRTKDIVFQYNVGAGLVTTQITVTEGFYTPSQLAAAMQILIRAIDPLLNLTTVTYGTAVPGAGIVPSVPAFTFATNNASTINFLPMTPNSAAYPYPASARQLYDVLGLVAHTDPAPPYTVIYGGYTMCQAIRYVDIVCSQITNNQSLKDNSSAVTNRDMLARVYVADPASQSNVDSRSSTFCPAGCMPFIIYKEYSSPKFIQWLPNQPVPGALKFEVYADDGALLTDYDENGQTGYNRTDWAMTLLVSEN